MKLRNFIIVLLAVFMVFAFVSCNNEPKVEPESSYKIVRLTAEKGRADGWNEYDKFELLFATPVEKGDVVSVTYRTTRPIDQYNVRVVTTTNGDHRWVYEQDKSALTSYDDSDPDGWITVTYEFSDYADRVSGNKENHAMTDELYEGVSDFAFHFRGKIVAGDFMEIKEVLWNDEPVDISTVAKAALGKSGDVVRNEKNVEVIDSKDSTWKKDLVTYYVMFYADPTQHKKDNPVGVNYENDDYLTGIGVAVKSGEKVAKPADPEREGYTFGGWCKDKIYDGTDTTRIWDFDNDTVTENRMLYAIWTLNNNTIKFNLNGGSAKENEAEAFADQAVATEGVVSMPVAEPVIEGGKLFAAWCTDAAGTQPYDFATKVTESFTLYARYDDPVYVTFDKNDGTTDELRLSRVPLLSGKTVTAPENPTYGDNYFAGWFLGDAENSFDFDTAITSDITLTAKWYEPVTVTLDPNYKVDEVAAETSTTTTGYGIPMAEPADLLREGFFFDKWTKDAAGEQPYVFGEEGEAVTAAFTLYAQWIPARTVTFNFNDGETPTTKDVIVKNGEKVEAPKAEKVKPGYCLVGWFADGSETAFDLANTAIEGDLTLTARWDHGSIYKMVATNGDGGTTYDKFILDWQDGSVPVNKGDTIAFAYRTTVDFQLFNIRDNEKTLDAQKDKWIYETGADTLTSYEVGADGWTYVTYSFAENFAGSDDSHTPNAGSKVEYPAKAFRIDFISKNIRPNDVLEVRDITLNGVEIDLRKVDTCATEFEKLTVIDEWTSHTVTFDTDGGSSIAPIPAKFGERIAKPDNPTKTGLIFDGWYSDAEKTKVFSFADSPITKDTVVYAKFVEAWAVTLNSNYGDVPVTKTVYVGKGAVQAAPRGVGRAGYFLEGWYDDADCSIPHDFTATVEKNTEIFAKWTEGATYQLTATKESDRFQFRWYFKYFKDVEGFKAGDVITFLVKFTPDKGTAPFQYRLRHGSSSAAIPETSFGTPDANDWIAVEMEIKDDYTDDSMQLAFLGSSKSVQAGDVAEVKGIAYNGIAFPMIAVAYQQDNNGEHRSCGAYEGCYPDVAVI